MDVLNFPFLSVITLSPLLAAVVILMLPKERGENARMLGLATMIIGVMLSLYVYIAFNQNLPAPDARWADTLMFMEEHPWVPSIGINYIMGVDGLSATLVLLTSIVGLGGVLISWGIDDRPREFYAFFMLLVAGVQGVFVSVDGFLLFFFYELAVLPMYIMIVIWGWKERREYAAMKLTLFLLIGSFISFIAFLVLMFKLPEQGLPITFDLRVWSEVHFAFSDQIKWFMPLFMGFGILAGVFPFHNWSPDGHVAAPTAVSMIHAGVLMKLGAYASMRVGIQILPEGTIYWMPFIIFLTLINVVYGAFVAMRQTDMKYLIGYSSVSHMGLVSMGFASMALIGFTGAGVQMVSHGIMTALFFSVVGMIYDRAHSRDLNELSGMMKVLPWTAVAFIIGGLVSMGMPGLSGFIAEFPIFVGVWQGGTMDVTGFPYQFFAEGTLLVKWFPFLADLPGLNPSTYYPYIAMIAALAIIITAAYIIRAIGNVFFGEYEAEKWHDMRPIRAIDKFTLAMFSAILIAIGVYPAIIVPIVESAMIPVVERLNEAQPAFTMIDTVQAVAMNLITWLGGA